MFNYDGLGAAMALSHVEDQAKQAKNHAARLEARVTELERAVLQLQYIVHELAKRGRGEA